MTTEDAAGGSARPSRAGSRRIELTGHPSTPRHPAIRELQGALDLACATTRVDVIGPDGSGKGVFGRSGHQGPHARPRWGRCWTVFTGSPDAGIHDRVSVARFTAPCLGGGLELAAA